MPLHYGVGSEKLMHTVREDVVRKLMTAANEGMKSAAAGTSADEVYSAYATMFRNAITVAVEGGADTTGIRVALQEMLALCDTTPGKVH